MKFLASCLAAALLVGTSALGARPAVDPVEQATLERISQRGQLLFDLDRAAWVATDALAAKFPSPAAAGIRGWIVTPEDAHLKVTFYGEEGGQPVAAHVFAVEDGRPSAEAPTAPGEALSPIEARMVTALGLAGAAARERGLTPCGNAPFNTIVVPPTDVTAPVDVYLMTPQVTNGVYPAGGHYLLHFAGEPLALESQRKFTNTCIDLSTNGAPAGAQAMLYVTHQLDPAPTEIHVFTALSAGTDLYVGTRGQTWMVSGAHIARVRP